MYKEMFDQLEGMMEEIMKRDSLFETLGKAYKKTLDSLIAAGFTREEAVQIIANQGMGMKVSG